jgi:protoporphyrinogen/coproporphyrinogen III oxidase
MATTRTGRTGRTRRRVIAFGAGISGLTAGFRLRQAGFDATVLERDDHVGGRMRTIDRDGYRLDVAAGILSTSYHEMRGLLRDLALIVRLTCDVFAFVRGDAIHRMRTHARRDVLATRLFGPRTKIAMAKIMLNMVRHRRVLDWTDPSRGADKECVIGGEVAGPYEQCWVMRSAGLPGLVGAGSASERCA